MKCKPGYYYCNTDKVCKPMPTGFDVPGQSKKPTEVGIGKPVGCNGTGKGESCPVHGEQKCPSMKEERDPKGPIKSYKSPQELAKKHKVPLSVIKKQLEMGMKVEKEHTTSDAEAKIIASQHIEELPNYYSKLKKVEKKKTNESLLVNKILEEISDSIFKRAFEGEVCPYCGCDPCECEEGQAYAEETDEDTLDESVRLSAQTGNMIMCMVSWRGKYIGIKMFFPQAKRPSRKEIEIELQKIYPGSKVVNFKVSELDPGEPFIQVSNRSVTEESKLEEAKKSEMPCNKPKAEAHGSGETGKSHVVKACSGGEEKLIRFGQKGVKGSPKKKGESEEYASRRHRFQTRHAKNIAKGKMSAAWWANKVKW